MKRVVKMCTICVLEETPHNRSVYTPHKSCYAVYNEAVYGSYPAAYIVNRWVCDTILQGPV
jgi:hypothetical protein